MKALQQAHVSTKVKVGGTIWCEVTAYNGNGETQRLYAPYLVTRITDAKWVKAKPKHGKADEVVFTPNKYSMYYYERGGGRYPYVAEFGDDPDAITAAYEAYLAQREATKQAERDRKDAERQARWEREQAEEAAAAAANASAVVSEIPGGMHHATILDRNGKPHEIVFRVEEDTHLDWDSGKEMPCYRFVGAFCTKHSYGRGKSDFGTLSEKVLRTTDHATALRLAVENTAKRIW